MKKQFLGMIVLTSLFCLIFFSAYAEPNATKTEFPMVAWTSNTNQDVITIQNGGGQSLVIAITVNKGINFAGINVKNCGTTTHADPGSTVICTTNDKTNPVNFTSDSATDAATGTYVIKQQ